VRKQTVSDTGILYFGKGNAKLGGDVATFSIPAGYTCPGASDCLSKFDRKKRKIVDGALQQHRCFAASMEAAFATVRNSTDRNWILLRTAKTVEVMTALIDNSMPPKYFNKIRVHVHGDYFSMDYMLSWLEAARRNPDRLFYSYTKSLHFLVKAKQTNMIPPNFVFTASRGGKFDNLIDEHNLREAVVVYHPDEASEMGLTIDHDDSLAMNPEISKFALLIHGTQKSGSRGAVAIKRLKKENINFKYARK
jgi:hypothetical protein